MAQIPIVDALKPAWPALAVGEGVVDAETVAAAALLIEALAVIWVTEAEAGTEVETEIDTAEERAVVLTAGAVEIAVDTEVEMTDTNDWVTTTPVVPVRVKAAE